MSTTIQIPGGSATLRDPADMRERHRRMIQAAGLPLAGVYQRLPQELRDKAAGKDEAAKSARRQIAFLFPACIKTAEEGAAFLATRDATVVALLESWTRDEPIPTLETLPDLEPELYDALVLAVQPLQDDVNDAVRPKNFGPVPRGDSEAPFGRSARSGTTSKRRASRAKQSPSTQE